MRCLEKMKIIEILRLSEKGLSQREIAASCGNGKSTVGDILKTCKDKGITHEVGKKMTDEELHTTIYPPRQTMTMPEPDWAELHKELTRHKNLNLQYTWESYHEQHPYGLSYSRYCAKYREYRKGIGRGVNLYHERKAGETMEVDWMGDTLECVADSKTGELTAAHFFVAVLGYSHYPYVEAFPNEQEPNWIAANVNAVHYYGGVPQKIVPDNCRTAVTTPKYYEPIINSAYWEFSEHYSLAIIPARVYKPKDKPAVESSVGWLETWLLEKLRGRKFFSFDELNKTIRKIIGELSARPFQKREGSRYSEFMKIDKPALKPLPPQKFEIADVKAKRVGDNYHLEYAGFNYSVPHTLHGQIVYLRATSNMVEVLNSDRERVASHKRLYNATGSKYSTTEAHMPTNHRAVHQARQFDGARYRSWAQKIGENTSFIIESILSQYRVEEQGFKSCMGILQFSKSYSNEELEEACRRARQMGAYTYGAVKKILKNGVKVTSGIKATPEHENIRGSAYYN